MTRCNVFSFGMISKKEGNQELADRIFQRILKDYPDSLQFFKKGYNVFICRTFSKAWGLAGLRIGYGITNSKYIDILNRIREPFNVNVLAQSCAEAVLDDEDYLKTG